MSRTRGLPQQLVLLLTALSAFAAPAAAGDSPPPQPVCPLTEGGCPPEPGPGVGPPRSDDPVPPADDSAALAWFSHAGVESTDPAIGAIPQSVSTLTRSRHGMAATFASSGLDPDSAYTLWWVVFNRPEFCATAPCTAEDLGNPEVEAGFFGGSGALSDGTGRIRLSSRARIGRNPDHDEPDPALRAGLVFPRRAEVHLVVRNHGPAENLAFAGLLEDALTTFRGGCRVVFACYDQQFAVHTP